MTELQAVAVLFWAYLFVGTVAAAAMGLLGAAWYQRRDPLAWWLTLLYGCIALDMYAKAMLRSAFPLVTDLTAFHLSRLAALGTAIVILGLTDYYFASHNSHLDVLRRIVRWWDQWRRVEGDDDAK